MPDWPDPLPEDWCWVHGRVEPDDGNAYRVCLECSHVFQTEADLIRDHNAVLAEVYKSLPEAPFPGGPLSRMKTADAVSGEKIWSCPHCIHDF